MAGSSHGAPFKMAGFSGFGNSPMKKGKKTSTWGKIKAAGHGIKAALTAHDQFVQEGAYAYRKAKQKYRKQGDVRS